MRFYSWKMLLYISSLSHWDREWYLPLKATDAIGGTVWQSVWSFENDPEFKSFHLMAKPLSWRLFRNSPWKSRQGAALYRRRQAQDRSFHILQDDYLISSEANVRNTLIGQAECAKWANLLKLVTSQIPLEIWDKLLKSFKNQGST